MHRARFAEDAHDWLRTLVAVAAVHEPTRYHFRVPSPRHPDPETCEVCGAPLVCLVCEMCPEHCLTDGDPDACWEAHEAWRLGKGDPTFGEDPTATVMHPPRGSVQPAPRPRWKT